jgi:hypothetical protein
MPIVGGPFDEQNEAFARGVLEGESRASHDPPPPAPNRSRPLLVLAILAAAVLVVWMVASRPGISQHQDVDVHQGPMLDAPSTARPFESLEPVLDKPTKKERTKGRRQVAPAPTSGGESVAEPLPQGGSGGSGARATAPNQTVAPKAARKPPKPAPTTEPDPIPVPLPSPIETLLEGVGEVIDDIADPIVGGSGGLALDLWHGDLEGERRRPLVLNLGLGE